MTSTSICLAQMADQSIQSFGDFQCAEIDTVLEMNDIDPRSVYDRSEVKTLPFVKLNLSPERAKLLCERCVLLKRMYEIWSEGCDLDSAIEALRNTKYGANENETYAFTVYGFYTKLNIKTQQVIRERVLDQIDPKGSVNLKHPDVTMCAVLVYGESCEQPEGSSYDPIKYVICDSTKNKWRKLTHVYIGRDLGEGRRGLVSKFSLRKRPFLGPTSTDAELAFLMANQAQCKPGSIVIDTFVGTGSILLPLAYFGAHCFGTDIDIRILKGTGKQRTKKTLRTNFEFYGLPMPELLRCDASERGSSMLRSDNLFDAIVCDPPYGIRAGARKSGSASRVEYKVSKRDMPHHIPKTQPYDVDDILDDMIENAARMLKLKGRLVFLLPACVGMSVKELPLHPCLRLRDASEQRCSSTMSRWLITYEKVQQYEISRRSEYISILKSCRDKRPSYSKMLEMMESAKLLGHDENKWSTKKDKDTTASLSNSERLRRADNVRAARMKIPGNMLFRSMKPPKFSQFDKDGIPTHDLEGNKLSKNYRNKLRKKWVKHEAQRKRFLETDGRSVNKKVEMRKSHSNRTQTSVTRKMKKLARRVKSRELRFENRSAMIFGTAPGSVGCSFALQFMLYGGHRAAILDSRPHHAVNTATDANSLMKEFSLPSRTSKEERARAFSISIKQSEGTISTMARVKKWISTSVEILFFDVYIALAFGSSLESYESFVRLVMTEVFQSNVGPCSVVLMAPSPQDKNSVSSCEKAYFTNEFDIMVTRLNRFVAETFRTCVKGMRVNAIRPGYVHGTAKIPSLPHGDRDRIVLRRVGHIDEVASAACFLASQDASYVTGVVLKVDGGFQTNIFK